VIGRREPITPIAECGSQDSWACADSARDPDQAHVADDGQDQQYEKEPIVSTEASPPRARGRPEFGNPWQNQKHTASTAPPNKLMTVSNGRSKPHADINGEGEQENNGTWDLTARKWGRGGTSKTCRPHFHLANAPSYHPIPACPPFESATSGRSKCRGCGEVIQRGELRFGERLPNPLRRAR